MKKRRSGNVARSMVLSAAVMLPTIGCSETARPVRNRYESIKDCEDDYGKGKCETGPQRAGGHTSGFYYFGPWYQSSVLGSSSSSNFVGASAGTTGYSSRASGIVNGAGEHMNMHQVRSGAASGHVSSFSSRGSSNVSRSSIGGISRGGFGGTGRSFSAGG